MGKQQKPLSIVEQMKQRALAQKRDKVVEQQAASTVATCPQCGAGRAKHDGLTACAYCGYEYTQATLSEGINIKETDNSRKATSRTVNGE